MKRKTKTTRKKRVTKTKAKPRKQVKPKAKTTKRKARTKRTDSLPRTLTCVKCGHVSCLGKESIEKKIAKTGSLEQLMSEYYCRKCNKEIREKSYKIMKERKEKLGPKKPKVSPAMTKYLKGELWFQKAGHAIVDHAPMNANSRKEECRFVTQRTCLMPHLAIDRACSNCPYFEVCECTNQKGKLYKELTTKKK